MYMDEHSLFVFFNPQTDSSELARREREGISGLLDSPLNVLSLNDEKAAGRNKRRKTANAANDGEANVAMVHASISGGWLCESMEFRSRESCSAVVRGLYDVATTSVRVSRPTAPNPLHLTLLVAFFLEKAEKRPLIESLVGGLTNIRLILRLESPVPDTPPAYTSPTGCWHRRLRPPFARRWSECRRDEAAR